MEICGVSHFETKFMPVLGLASNDKFSDVVAMVVWDLSEKTLEPTAGRWSTFAEWGAFNKDLSATFKYLEYDLNHVVLVDS